ncbi:hypothetical protein AU476_07530 [Cupriavidus sp. UYMSc13B]|nr:hypothetical protein AU476_07530 [Cupriavidus sp. UYMSc13B]
MADGVTLTDLSTGDAAFFDDDIGLYTYSGFKNGLVVTQLDGNTYRRAAQARANVFALDLQNPGEYLVHESLQERDLYLFNKRAGVFGELVVSNADLNYVRGVQVRARTAICECKARMCNGSH